MFWCGAFIFTCISITLRFNEIAGARGNLGRRIDGSPPIEPPPSENEVMPLLPMEDGDAKKSSNDPFSVSGDPRYQKNILEFRLANRLAVAVCDTYDNYLSSGKPYKGQINFNITVQNFRSPVPATTCQSFKIKRCYGKSQEEVAADKECGWTKVPTC